MAILKDSKSCRIHPSPSKTTNISNIRLSLADSKRILIVLIVILVFIFTFVQRTSTQNQEVSQFKEKVDFIRDWSLRFGRDIHIGTGEVTCIRSLQDQYDPLKSDSSKTGPHRPTIVSTDWPQTHADIVKTVSNTMSWHRDAVKVIAETSESLASNYTFKKNLRFNYVDVHRLHGVDEETDLENSIPEEPEMDSSSTGNDVDNIPDNISGEQAEPLPQPSELIQATETADDSEEWQTPIKYLELKSHPNFGQVLINTEESAVHVPVHIYPADEQVMNDIAWSDELTQVFRTNFMRNPKLTTQFFASQTGFLRLFPAQKWPVPREAPDLYDARMRPWYLAGSSSRKDVVILVDSSGSMTGSRRDIARGVVLEILDTLTDNDYFTVLKFSDTIQQVGVPVCPGLRKKRKASDIPIKNTIPNLDLSNQTLNGSPKVGENIEIESFYLLPANGRNIRYVKSNFSISTSGIANFSQALVTAFEILRNYQDDDNLGSQCNQAIMLVTDGSPSDFEEIFNRYNYPNAPVRIFTYLIGREAGDVTHTKLMACHNRGYYTHVINLAEVRETVQQYIPVMARPLVLNGTHPITWTPAYGELTFQILTDWIWESKRRERARTILNAQSVGSIPTIPNTSSRTLDQDRLVPEIKVQSSDSQLNDLNHVKYSVHLVDQEYGVDDKFLEALDLFGYMSNPECFFQTRKNDLLTTVVQPVYDTKTEATITEKFLVKNIWTEKATLMRTARLLGVAAADMRINDIVDLAPSHKLGPNAYAVMLTNNGFAMHHPDLRSILEPFVVEPGDYVGRILKPFFSSIDLTQVEHILEPESDGLFLQLRKEAVSGLTGWRQLLTKRAIDCQNRVQVRNQSFYYKPIDIFPFSFIIAVPQPYGSHRIKANIDVKSPGLSEKLSSFFTNKKYDLFAVHPDYKYCEGPSNQTITSILDMLYNIESGRPDEVQWKPSESSNPPLSMPGKIVCDKELVQSLVYDAVATSDFSLSCSPTDSKDEWLAAVVDVSAIARQDFQFTINNLVFRDHYTSKALSVLSHYRSKLMEMYGVRFLFVSTRSGLTRARVVNGDEKDITKFEALSFTKYHARAVDEVYYSRTVDFNMLVNETATLIQVPFNIHEKIKERLNKYEMGDLDNDISNQDTSHDYFTVTDDLSNPERMTNVRLRVKDMNFMEKIKSLKNSSLHVIATQSVIASEGSQRAVAGVTGAFYDYSSFVERFLSLANQRMESEAPTSDPDSEHERPILCGHYNDSVDCLLVDNNGYIIVSEDLNYIGRSLKEYNSELMSRLVEGQVYREINITDYQAICLRYQEKQPTSSSSFGLLPFQPLMILSSLVNNFIGTLMAGWTFFSSLSGYYQAEAFFQTVPSRTQQIQSNLAIVSNKTYLRPCERVNTLYDINHKLEDGSRILDGVQLYNDSCKCETWFIIEPVPYTNLIMIIINDGKSNENCLACESERQSSIKPSTTEELSITDERVCSSFERESKMFRKRLDSCFSNHPEEEQIKLCGAAGKSGPINVWLSMVSTFIIYPIIYLRLNGPQVLIV